MRTPPVEPATLLSRAANRPSCTRCRPSNRLRGKLRQLDFGLVHKRGAGSNIQSAFLAIEKVFLERLACRGRELVQKVLLGGHLFHCLRMIHCIHPHCGLIRIHSVARRAVVSSSCRIYVPGHLRAHALNEFGLEFLLGPMQ